MRGLFSKALVVSGLFSICMTANAEPHKNKTHAEKNAGKSATTENSPNIAPEKLKSLLDAKTPITIIDANGQASYDAGHVPGAIHFAKHEGKLKAGVAPLPADKNQLIVAYCGGPKCLAWQDAAKEVKALNYTNVVHMKAGIKGWNEKKYPVEKNTQS